MLGYGLVGYLQSDRSVIYTSHDSLGWNISRFTSSSESLNKIINSVQDWFDNPKTYKSIKRMHGIDGWNTVPNRDAFVEMCRPNSVRGQTWVDFAFLMKGNKMYSVNFRYKNDKEKALPDQQVMVHEILF